MNRALWYHGGMKPAAFALVVLCLAGQALCAEVRVILPDGQATQVEVASGKPVPATLTLKDGTKLVGVNMSWYAPAKVGDGPISNEDRKEIEGLLTVPSFYNKVRLLELAGDNQHAVGLVELIRDTEFHASGTEIVWRVELWYFEFQNGGWAKVSQQNKIVDRQRFKGREVLEKYLSMTRWVPKLGRLVPDQAKELKLEARDLLRSSELGTK
jgi:hypothetical protein